MAAFQRAGGGIGDGRKRQQRIRQRLAASREDGRTSPVKSAGSAAAGGAPETGSGPGRTAPLGAGRKAPGRKRQQPFDIGRVLNQDAEDAVLAAAR